MVNFAHSKFSVFVMAQFPDTLRAEVQVNVQTALAEDLGSGDLIAQLSPAGRMSRGTVICREAAVLAGTGRLAPADWHWETDSCSVRSRPSHSVYPAVIPERHAHLMAAWLSLLKAPRSQRHLQRPPRRSLHQATLFLPQCPLSQCLLWMNHRS